MIMNKEQTKDDLAAEDNKDATAEKMQAEDSKSAAEENISEAQIELSREELVEEIKEKNKKIEEMDAEIEDLLSRLQRLQADFVNYRKRSKREKSEMTTKGKVDLCSSLLAVLDNFERALKAEENENDFYKGVEMIYKQLLKSFSDQGIEEIAAEGKEFDPEYHEAIMTVESSEFEAGIVTDVIQKGFILDDRVIRPAMVKVAG